MTRARPFAFRRFLGFVCLLIIVTSALVLLGWPPTRRLAGEGGVWAMLAGAAVSLIASVLGGLPVWMTEARGGRMRAQQIIGSLAIRFLLVLFGALYVVLNGLVDKVPFLVWVGLSYLFLLPVDVRYVLRGLSEGDPDER